MDEPKYVLCPGWITSKTDKQRHYIQTHQLAMLYKVTLRECVVEPGPASLPREKELFRKRHAGLLWLYPDYHGYYELPVTPGP